MHQIGYGKFLEVGSNLNLKGRCSTVSRQSAGAPTDQARWPGATADLTCHAGSLRARKGCEAAPAPSGGLAGGNDPMHGPLHCDCGLDIQLRSIRDTDLC